jgi:hypothetical protein
MQSSPPEGSPPRIQLATDHIRFEARAGHIADPSSQSVGITNAGGGTMHLGMIPRVAYAEGAATGWLSHSYLESGIAAGTPGTRLAIYVTTAHLAPGAYDATVTIVSSNAENSPAALKVSLRIT